MGWTPRQQEAIESRGKSLLVSAAAGSGKTAVLVERITGLLREGGDLSRMLVVTFTNAAAAEMKERIAKTLGTAAVRHSHISTFHSYALDIIRRYYYITGIDPGLSVCDEYRQTIMKNKAMDRMFEEYFEADDPDFIAFLNCYASAKSNYRVKEMILEMHRFLESLPDPEAFLDATEDMSSFDIDSYLDYAAKEGKECIKRAAAYYTAAKELLLNPGIDGALPMPKLAAKLASDIDRFDAMLSKFDEGKAEEAFALIDSFNLTRLAKTKDETASFVFIEDKFSMLQKACKGEFKFAKDKFASLNRETLEAEKEALRVPLGRLVKLTRRFDELYRANKRKEAVMDFADIEHYALKILENDDAATEIRDGFDYIFVDEYQDSNSVQDELIRRIAKDDNLFFVGDVKQSIYKFRHAEPELFLEKYNSFRNGKTPDASVVDLNANFRSKAPVIDFVNKVFSVLMTPGSCGISYDEDAALAEGTPYSGEFVYNPKFYLVNTVSEADAEVDTQIEELRNAEVEALEVVNIIKEYYSKPIYDSKQNCVRPLAYSDMVILMRSVKDRGECIYQALSNADIPVFLQRGGGYFDTPEIQVSLNLLRIIDNFRQDVPLISVLAFPSFGFSSKELADIRIFANEKDLHRIPYCDALKLYAKEGPDVAIKTHAESFLQKIDFWRKKAMYLPLDRFIWELLAESGILEYARALPSGVQREANLRALADKAHDYESRNAGGLYGFISYIEVISEKGKDVDTGQVSVLGEGADAVRIMTIHKSKGLEFPFVLLAGTASKMPNSKGQLPIYAHKDFGVSMKLVEPEKGLYAELSSADIINIKKKKEDLAETIRVLYVALTRAKDIFVASAACAKADALLHKDWSVVRGNPAAAVCYMDFLLPFFSAKDISYVTKAQLSAMEKTSEGSAAAVLDYLDTGFDVDETDLPIPREEIRRRLEFDYSPKEDDLLKTKYSVSELAELSREEHGITHSRGSHRKPQFIESTKLDAAAKGTAYHSVMEHIPFTPECKSAAEIALFIEELRNKNILRPEEAAAIDPARIEAFFKSETGQRALAAKEIYKEAPFVLKTEYKGRTIYVQGTIDCYFREGDEYVLLDYKSNYIDKKSLDPEKERLKENYIPQLKLYRQALNEITGTPIKEGILYLFGIDDIIKVC